MPAVAKKKTDKDRSERIRVLLSVSPSTHAKLSQMAERDHRTLSQQITMLVEVAEREGR